MPNGRSGGFIIEKADLKSLVKTYSDATVIATLLEQSKPLRHAHALETARLVDECLHDHIAVEEQDHTAYVIHLSNAPVVWLLVGPEAPLFPDLRQRHQRWATEHPDWKGWFAF